MPTIEDETRDALRRLSAPPERARFFEQLRHRMQEQDRRAARHWRAIGLALAAVVLAVVAAASVLAAETHRSAATKVVLERTVSCRVLPRTHAVYIAAYVTLHVSGDANNPPRVFAGHVDVTTLPWKTHPSDPMSPLRGQFSFATNANSLTVDQARCNRSPLSVPFNPAGLSSNGTQTQSFNGGIQQVCTGAARVLIHYRVTEAGGAPLQAQVAIRDDDRRRRPLAYIEWSPKRVTTFTRSTCSPYRYIPYP